MKKTEAMYPGRGGAATKIRLDEAATGDLSVCSDHTFPVVRAHVEQVAKNAGATDRMVLSSMIHDLLWATGTHEKCPVVDKESLGKRRLDEERKPAASDELTDTFMAVRPQIHKDSFTYNFMLTQMRQLMVLKKVEGYRRFVHGKNFSFAKTEEGMDVLRYFSVYKVTQGNVAVEALRGRRSFEKGVSGEFEIRDVVFLGVPSSRQIRE